MQSTLYVKSQAEILSAVRRQLRDPSGVRWTDVEIYSALNDGLMTWDDRVIIPHVYDIPSGWSNGTARYTLPSYIREPIDPQQKRYTLDWLQSASYNQTDDMWVDVNNFEVMPAADGSWVVQFPDYLDSGDGRIIWWAHNGTVPLEPPTVNTTISADETTLIIDTEEDIPEVGYIRAGSEWMHYAGRSVGSTVTLSNLRRGLLSTSAAQHLSGVDVEFGIGANTQELYIQLRHYILSYLHGLYLNDATDQEQAHHERMRLHYLDLSNQFWRTYTPPRSPKLRFDRRTIGDVSAYGAGYRG